MKNRARITENKFNSKPFTPDVLLGAVACTQALFVCVQAADATRRLSGHRVVLCGIQMYNIDRHLFALSHAADLSVLLHSDCGCVS